MLETDIEKKVVNWGKANGFLTIKFTPCGERGWPDRIFISPTGTHVWVEFKKPGEEPRPLQDFRMGELDKRTVEVHWFDNATDAINCLSGFT